MFGQGEPDRHTDDLTAVANKQLDNWVAVGNYAGRKM